MTAMQTLDELRCCLDECYSINPRVTSSMKSGDSMTIHGVGTLHDVEARTLSPMFARRRSTWRNDIEHALHDVEARTPSSRVAGHTRGNDVDTRTLS
jgi:hypothetical protein